MVAYFYLFCNFAGNWIYHRRRKKRGRILGWVKNTGYPSDVLLGAWKNLRAMPGHFLTFLPSLLETINIAAVSTLVGGMIGLVFSLLAAWSSQMATFDPVFRRLMDDVCRTRVIIALILIFILGGGPVPAMIAIAFHTSGALGKMFWKSKNLTQTSRRIGICWG